jgi:Fe-coproporphyrin III synthase
MDLTVITTYRCDSRCSMCHIWQHPTLPKDEITAADLHILPGGIDNLNITGGEPTLRSDLADIVAVLHPKAKTLEISSNGLHPERIEPIIRRYPDIKVRFSLEALGLRNDEIRGEKGGFATKTAGLRRLREAGGTDLGFATVIQDDNLDQLIGLYEFCRKEGFEFSTSALHNGFQFHKSDNIPYDRVRTAKALRGLIAKMLESRSVKNWFRAYLNLGLIHKVLGRDRLIPCTAATDFLFVDPWGDVYACNVRPDLLMGNIRDHAWPAIWASDTADRVRAQVGSCAQNCWMVTTARTAMRNPVLPALPKVAPLLWVLENKVRVALGRDIRMDREFEACFEPAAPRRVFYLDAKVRRVPTLAAERNYTVYGEYFNR